MINHLDCTFRDGGYYNKWDFPLDIVQNYLDSMAAINVSHVELGFRFIQHDEYLGPFAFTKNDFIKNFVLPKKIKAGVMINASDLLKHRTVLENLNILFPSDSNNSFVNFVRIACHIKEIEKIVDAIPFLKNLGFIVCVNLMQISDRSDTEILEVLYGLKNYPLDVFYIADSTGSMDTDRTKKVIKLIKNNIACELGIHAHNNLELALSNTLQAVKYGCNWVDSTITGMGRGPGNAQTELLAVETNRLNNNTSFNFSNLLCLIDSYFAPIKNQYGWGTNYYYYLGGKKGIHPTYIQTMIEDNRYSPSDIIPIIQRLSLLGGKSFDKELLESINSNVVGNGNSTFVKWRPLDFIKKRDVLILGSGDGILKHKPAIENFIKKFKPIVLNLNANIQIDPNLIDLIIACNPFRILADFEKFIKLKIPLVCSVSNIDKSLISKLSKNEVLDYNFTIKKNKFIVNDIDCIIPKHLAIVYALAIANSGNANKIYFAGFDGFSSDDTRQIEMNNFLSLYSENEQLSNIVSITPTSYQLKTQSIYSF